MEGLHVMEFEEYQAEVDFPEKLEPKKKGDQN